MTNETKYKETESQMYGVWHMTEVAGTISVEKECSLTESRKMVIHEKRKLYTHFNNQLQLD